MSISVRNLTFGYAKETTVLRDINLEIHPGEFALVVGQNGAGKSTFLKLLNGILKPQSGSITINGLDTSRIPTSTLAAHIAVTFQNPADQIFASTVRDEVLFGPRILKKPSPDYLTDSSLALFRMTDVSSKHPYDLPPAQRKLLTIASAAASDESILAFDEPSASLSQTERLILLKGLAELRNNNRTLLVVSHDLDFFVPLATRLIVLANGRIVHDGKPMDIVNHAMVAKSAGLRLPLLLRLKRMIPEGLQERN
jgi:energy-coupling factor transporter ATP-binding protein EcfA2